MELSYTNLRQGLISGIKKGFSGYIWMFKILVPISFLTSIIVYTGWLNKIDFLIKPCMSLLSLPSIAALPLVAGILTGIYGGIASMILVPLTQDQMLLIAIFLLISHSIINEGVVQAKSGINPFTVTLIRLAASVVTVIIVAQFLESETTVVSLTDSIVSDSEPFLQMLKKWSITTIYLCIKMFGIIMILMIILETIKALKLDSHILRGLSPVLKIMGLDQKVGMLWLTAAAFGVSYGGAVIVEEAKKTDFTRQQLAKLHISIGINHALFEDPVLFFFLGLNPFWLWVPRLVIAIIAVRLFSLWCRFFR